MSARKCEIVFVFLKLEGSLCVAKIEVPCQNLTFEFCDCGLWNEESLFFMEHYGFLQSLKC